MNTLYSMNRCVSQSTVVSGGGSSIGQLSLNIKPDPESVINSKESTAAPVQSVKCEGDLFRDIKSESEEYPIATCGSTDISISGVNCSNNTVQNDKSKDYSKRDIKCDLIEHVIPCGMSLLRPDVVKQLERHKHSVGESKDTNVESGSGRKDNLSHKNVESSETQHLRSYGKE